jgi:hypothetical protein
MLAALASATNKRPTVIDRGISGFLLFPDWIKTDCYSKNSPPSTLSFSPALIRFQGTSPNIFYTSTGEAVYCAAGVAIIYNKATHTQVRMALNCPIVHINAA